MSEQTIVTGTPQLALSIGGGTVQASYASGNNTNQLLFTYTILGNQNDSNGISIPSNALSLSGGTLRDAANNNATLTSTAVADDSNYIVDNVSVALLQISGGTGGFVVNGQSAGNLSSFSVANAGDVNADGLTDIIIGSRLANNQAGRSYVVFGKTTTTAIDLNAIANGTGGFAIDGANSQTTNATGATILGDLSGYSVSSAGDINGDGLGDVMIGAPLAGPSGTGIGYIVFGKTNSTKISLNDVFNGTGGFAVVGNQNGNGTGVGIATAGDVNGDGVSDFIIGVPGAPGSSSPIVGSSYVVFGRTSNNTNINVLSLISGTSTRGFLIAGISVGDNFGISVAGTGDINGDGLADLIIGAPGRLSGTNASSAYVVFGKASTSSVNATDVRNGTGGFSILDRQLAIMRVGVLPMLVMSTVMA